MTINGWTIALQAINFLVLVWLLQRFLYRPAMAVMARRKELVEKAFEEASSAKAEAEAEQQRYQSEQEALAASRDALLARAHSEIEADRDKVLEQARGQAADLLEKARQQIAAERDVALDDLKSQVAGLSVSMAGQLLSRLAAQPGNAPALADAALTSLLQHIDGLPAEERRALDEDLGGPDARVETVTAVPLDADAQKRWRAALQQRFPGTGSFTFDSSPELIGGVELRCPRAVVSLAWSEQLKQGKEALLANDVAD